MEEDFMISVKNKIEKIQKKWKILSNLIDFSI